MGLPLVLRSLAVEPVRERLLIPLVEVIVGVRERLRGIFVMGQQLAGLRLIRRRRFVGFSEGSSDSLNSLLALL